ncbi:MAG: PEP-CTERM sorting domain-containing protein, partial [Akkermansia sp.]|nr:PEP-CTERM sorting domain-containing protein [Akkermansia sp.]
HILSDYGDSKIEQSGKAGTVLNIGGIGAFNSKYDAVVDTLDQYGASYDDATGELVSGSEKVDVRPVLELIQSGAGEINIFKGVDFSDHRKDNIEDSSITQSGGGEINLGGEYKGVTFDITQEDKGGTLNINGNLAADVVKQDGAGSIVAASGKTLSANSVYAGTVNETLDADGNVTSRDASVEISGDVTSGKVTLTGGTLKTETSEAGDVTVTNTGNLSVGQIVVNEGTFINERNGNINYTAPSALLALGSDEDNAQILLSGTANTSDVVVAGGEFVNIGNVGNVLVEEGGTLTMENQSSAGSIVMDGGRINVTGESSVGSLTLNGENNVINFDFNGEVAPSIVLTSGDALDLSSTTIKVTVSTEMLENLAGQDFELFGGNVENITNATYIFTDGDADTSNDKIADVILGSTSGSIKVEATVAIPEPTTATLSLLALAGLCARRRRR